MGAPMRETRQEGFTLNLPPDPAPVLGDAGQLVRALGNLLDSAVKLTPEGGDVRAEHTGHGARFTLRLPHAPRTTRVPRAAPP